MQVARLRRCHGCTLRERDLNVSQHIHVITFSAKTLQQPPFKNVIHYLQSGRKFAPFQARYLIQLAPKKNGRDKEKNVYNFTTMETWRR